MSGQNETPDLSHPAAARAAAMEMANEMFAAEAEEAPAAEAEAPGDEGSGLESSEEAPGVVPDDDTTKIEPEPEPKQAARPDDDILEKVRAEMDARKKREDDERSRQQEIERAKQDALREAREQLREEIRLELLRDPQNVVRSREDLEAITTRILDGERAKGDDRVSELEKRLADAEQRAQAREQAEAERQRQAGYEQVRQRFMDYTGDGEKFPLLAKLDPEERFDYGMSVAKRHPDLDDETIARYVEKQLRSTLDRLAGAQAPDDAGQKQKTEPSRRSKGTTLTNDKAAETAAGVPDDPIQAARLEATRLARSYLQNLPQG